MIFSFLSLSKYLTVTVALLLSFISSAVPILPQKDSGTKAAPEGLDDSFEPWSSKKAGILSKYTTSEKLSITTVSATISISPHWEQG